MGQVSFYNKLFWVLSESKTKAEEVGCWVVQHENSSKAVVDKH